MALTLKILLLEGEMKKITVIFLVLFLNAAAFASTQQAQVIEVIFSTWESRFAANQKLSEQSNKSIYVIPQPEIAYQEKRILELQKNDPESANKLLERFHGLEQQNIEWAKKKEKNNESSQPFPKAKMRDKSLEKEMGKLLGDRGVKVKDLVITDKDWWEQPGEFRYLNTAVMSSDEKGEYWLNVSFRQIKTLSGYAPTEIWDFKDARIRLP